MRGVNVQVRISAETNAELVRLSVRSKSAFARAAIEEKIRREKNRRLEGKWIRALEQRPDETRDAEDWLAAEEWGEP